MMKISSVHTRNTRYQNQLNRFGKFYWLIYIIKFFGIVFQSISIPELSVLSGMSARERNRARRKAKMAARKNTREKEQEDPWYIHVHSGVETASHTGLCSIHIVNIE